AKVITRNRRRSRARRVNRCFGSNCGKVAGSMPDPRAGGATLLVSGTPGDVSRRKGEVSYTRKKNRRGQDPAALNFLMLAYAVCISCFGAVPVAAALAGTIGRRFCGSVAFLCTGPK